MCNLGKMRENDIDLQLHPYHRARIIVAHEVHHDNGRIQYLVYSNLCGISWLGALRCGIFLCFSDILLFFVRFERSVEIYLQKLVYMSLAVLRTDVIVSLLWILSH